MLRSALDGELPLADAAVASASAATGARPAAARPHVEVRVDVDASASATVVEVHAPDDVGLLASVAAVFADLGVDVSLAIVSTTGERVVDVFYVRDAPAAKPPIRSAPADPGHADRPAHRASTCSPPR